MNQRFALRGIGLMIVAASSLSAQYAAWWRLDEGTGTAVADYTANANNGTMANAAWTSAGKFNGAMNFDGATSIVNVPNSASLSITGSIALEAWVRPTAVPTQFAPIVVKWDDIGVANRAYFLTLQQTNIGMLARFDVSHNGLFGGTCTNNSRAWSCTDSAFAYSNGVIPLNQWTHLIGVFDATTKQIALYVNGALNGNIIAQSANIFNVPTGVTIGSGRMGSDQEDFFTGSIDEPRIWNRALDAAYIAKLYKIESLTYSKLNTGANSVPIKSASSTNLSYDIRIQNNTAGAIDLTGFQVWDVIPAEFDLASAPVATGCAVTATQPAGATKGSQPKLEPELLSMQIAGSLAAAASCVVNVAAKTDINPASAKGNTPVKYEPTSCPADGKIILNEGIRVFDTTLQLTPFEVIGPVSPIYLNCAL